MVWFRDLTSGLRRSFLVLLATGVACAAVPAAARRSFPPGVRNVVIPAVPGVRRDLLKNIAPIIEKSIAGGDYPGAVVLAAHRGRMIYRGVFGNRRILPDVAPMRLDTIFDLASLTKVTATTPAIMQLIEEGKLRLDTPVAHYWPAFAQNGKGTITVRELLTHTSGLPPDIPTPELLQILHLPPTGFPGQPPQRNVNVSWHGQQAAMRMVEEVGLIHPPGTTFVYSDINFITLADLVQIITGQRVDQYAAQHIYEPLGMKSTMFNPPASLRDRIAPTQVINGKLRWGQVHDPTATAMGGVSGLAGLFSDAHDLGLYAQALVDGGKIPASVRKKGGPAWILGPLTVLKMTTAQTPVGMTEVRGLGWDIDSGFSNRGVLFPGESFGHTGWTGTSIWIDPATKTWLILLTSRTHPTPAPLDQVVFDRRTIANIIAGSLTDIKTQGLSNTGVGERTRAYPPQR